MLCIRQTSHTVFLLRVKKTWTVWKLINEIRPQVYLCKSREEGINFTHSLMQKDSSIQDFRDWKKMRKIFKHSPEILTQLSSTFSYTVTLFLRHTKKTRVWDQWPSERSSLWCQKQEEVYMLILQGLKCRPFLTTETSTRHLKTPARCEKAFLSCLNLSINVCSSPVFCFPHTHI